ncbi:hypothetical protein PCL_03384 [Purpureocillium lilacinum]|uniref:Uncharacterized protein n=1 Tax=Purpureocillium lilacinum TaxID=33203 RepID=A0A2U3ENY6_PURLI|nr:hypothetical protein PCL_03384 [Purpureocillium lilacinum]
MVLSAGAQYRFEPAQNFAHAQVSHFEAFPFSAGIRRHLQRRARDVESPRRQGLRVAPRAASPKTEIGGDQGQQPHNRSTSASQTSAEGSDFGWRTAWGVWMVGWMDRWFEVTTMTRPLARFVFQLRSYLRAGAWTDDAAGASRTYTIAEKQHPSPSYRVLGRIINRGNDLHGRTTRHLRSTTPLWTKFKLNHVGAGTGGAFFCTHMPPSVLGSWARGRRPGLAKQGYERPVAMETGPRRVGGPAGFHFAVCVPVPESECQHGPPENAAARGDGSPDACSGGAGGRWHSDEMLLRSRRRRRISREARKQSDRLAEASSGASELAVLAVLHYPTLHESRTTTGIDLLNIASSCRTPATCDYQLARPDADEQARTSKYPTALERVRTFLRAGAGSPSRLFVFFTFVLASTIDSAPWIVAPATENSPELNQIDAPALPRRGSTGESVAGAGAIPAIWVPRPVPQQSGWLDRSRWETSRCGGEETTRRTGQCPLHGTRECSPGVQQQHHGRRPGGPPPLRPAVPLRRQICAACPLVRQMFRMSTPGPPSLPALELPALSKSGALPVAAAPMRPTFWTRLATLRKCVPGIARGDERTYLAVGPLHPPTHRAAPQLQPQAYQDSQRSTRQGVGPVQMLLRQRRHCERGREVARSLAARPARALRLRRRPTSLSASLGEPTPRFERRWKGLAECASVMICCAVLCERPPGPSWRAAFPWPQVYGGTSCTPTSGGGDQVLPPIQRRCLSHTTPSSNGTWKATRRGGAAESATPHSHPNSPTNRRPLPRLAPPSLVVLDAPPPSIPLPLIHSLAVFAFPPSLSSHCPKKGGKKASSGALLTLTRPARQYARFLLLRLAFSFIASAAPYTRFCSHPASRTGVATPTSFCFAGATANIDAFLVSSSRKHCANLSRLSAYHRRDQLAGTCHRPIIFEPRFGCQSLSGLAPFSESLAEPPRRHCVLERLSQGFFVQGRGLASETILHNPQHTAPMFVEG